MVYAFREVGKRVALGRFLVDPTGIALRSCLPSSRSELMSDGKAGWKLRSWWFCTMKKHAVDRMWHVSSSPPEKGGDAPKEVTALSASHLEV